jgi:hypothetical protein
MESVRVDTARRAGAAVSLILAPLLLLVAFASHPTEASTGVGELRVVVAQTDRWNLVHLLFLLSMALFILAAMALLGQLRAGGAWYGLVGVALTVAGAVSFSGLFGAELAMGAMAGLPTGQREGLAPGFAAIAQMQGPLAITFLGLGLPLGLVTFAVGLVRTRAAPRWTGVVVCVAACALVGGLFDNTVGAAGAALLLLGLGAVGLHLLWQPGMASAPLTARSSIDRSELGQPERAG